MEVWEGEVPFGRFVKTTTGSSDAIQPGSERPRLTKDALFHAEARRSQRFEEWDLPPRLRASAETDLSAVSAVVPFIRRQALVVIV